MREVNFAVDVYEEETGDVRTLSVWAEGWYKPEVRSGPSEDWKPSEGDLEILRVCDEEERLLDEEEWEKWSKVIDAKAWLLLRGY